MDLRRILVPTDFSDCANAALDHALFIARRFGARVDVLSIWALPIDVLPDWVVQPPGGPPQAASSLVRGRSASKLETLTSELRQRYENVQGRLETGDPAEVIVQLVGRDHYDLVVMGTHGRTGLSHLWSGSVAEEVVRRAACPVLTIREQVKHA